MVVIRGTKKFLDRVDGPHVDQPDQPDQQLGSWYANVLFFKPRLALLVNEATLLPLFMPLAPAATLLQRFPHELARLLEAHRVAPSFIEHQVAGARTSVLARTVNRRVVGVMTEYAQLADYRRERHHDPTDPRALSIALARTPMSPLYKTHTSADRALAALAADVERLVL